MKDETARILRNRPAVRLGAILLALLMLAGALCSCADQTNGEITTEDPGTATVDLPETTSDIYSDVPVGSFGGAEIRILNNVNSWALTTLESSEQYGDTISDAVTERNKILESQIGVKLVIESNTNVLSAIRNDQDTQSNV